MNELSLMHAHLAKLLELGVDGEWLEQMKITPDQARQLLMGILYLREMHSEHSWERIFGKYSGV
jgi:hypothetical protein